MSDISRFPTLCHALGRFRANSSGAIIPLLAGGALCLLMIIGGAIEFSRRYSAEIKLQQAVDASILAAHSRYEMLAATQTRESARPKAEAEGRAMFDSIIQKSPSLSSSKPQLQLKWSDANLSGSATGKFQLIFNKLVPAHWEIVQASGTSQMASQTAFEISLMVDNSGSMTFTDGRPTSRMTLLRNALRDFVDDMFDYGQKAAANVADPVRVAVVPWSITTNIATERPAATSLGGRSPRAPISDGGSGKPTTNVIGRSGKVTIDSKYFKKTPWAGCVQANGAESAFGYSDAAVNLWKAQAVPPTMNADPNVGCPSPMLGLSGNRQQVIDTLERMKPAFGGTHADVGLRWGLRTLTPSGGWPEFFGTAQAPKNWNSPTKKIAVLITDGKNEKAQPYPGFWGCDVFDPVCSGTYSSSQLDTMMEGWCKAFRETYGITLYTVAMNVTDAGAVQRLKECVGPDASRAYSINSANLGTTLKAIAQDAIKLKLTH